MAKKNQKHSSKHLLIISCSIILALLGWWTWHSNPLAHWKDQILCYVSNQNIVTLEARFPPEQIVELHRQELLGNNKRVLQNTILKYYPYLLLDIKYSEDSKTREGVLLWGLNNGEMVLDTGTWEISHGFRDCLECKAQRSDFKILQALARRQGVMSIEELQKELQVEREVLSSWIEDTKKKFLIIQKSNTLQLHFENPKLLVTPQTQIKQHLVSKPLESGQKTSKTYSQNQIIEITRAAFGNDFSIRNVQEIFLPVYSLEILNPDGSTQISEWNALTGQSIIPHYFSRT